MVQTSLDPNLPIPLYHQLKNALLGKIKSGEWVPGFCIPTESELIDSYEVSRTTVREAVIELVREGYLMKKQGKGTFVNQTRLVERLGRLTGFAEEMAQQGYIPSASLLHVKDMGESDKLDSSMDFLVPELSGEIPLVNITRIRLADEEPIAIEYSFWPKDIANILSQEDLSSIAFYAVLERNGVYLQYADENISAINANQDDAKYLKVQEGSALIEMRRFTYDVNQRLIEYTCTRYRGDRYTYHVKLHR